MASQKRCCPAAPPSLALIACLPPTGWCCSHGDVTSRPLRLVSSNSFLPRSRPNPQGRRGEGRAATHTGALRLSVGPRPVSFWVWVSLACRDSAEPGLRVAAQSAGGWQKKVLGSSLLFRCESPLLVLKDPSHLLLVGGRGCGRRFPRRTSFLRNVKVIDRAET